MDPETREGQIAMLVHDLQTNFPALLRELHAGGDPTMIARRFAEVFEAGGSQALISSPGFMASHMRTAAGIARGGVVQNNNITTTVHAPSPASAAAQTVEGHTRALEGWSRQIRPALV